VFLAALVHMHVKQLLELNLEPHMIFVLELLRVELLQTLVTGDVKHLLLVKVLLTSVLMVVGQDVRIAIFVGDMVVSGLLQWVGKPLDVVSNYLVDVMVLLDLELPV
jgi:hypothetical protein